MKGKFITIYGINNIGKTYHSKLLVERLKKMGKRAVYLKYPIYDQEPTGPLINKILRSNKKQKISEEELQLWFVLNRYQFEPTLKKMLADGKIVVAEDYIATGIAWGTAKGANQSELEFMNKYLVQPDLALFMDGERVLKAKEKKHIHESDDKLAAKCQAVYRKLSRKYGWKKVLVDADPKVTAERVWEVVQKDF
jgi:thymidylate kinase